MQVGIIAFLLALGGPQRQCLCIEKVEMTSQITLQWQICSSPVEGNVAWLYFLKWLFYVKLSKKDNSHIPPPPAPDAIDSVIINILQY